MKKNRGEIILLTSVDMEDVIRDAGGATDFEAIITYPNTETQIASSYNYTYTVMGNEAVDTFNNVNPDEANASLGLTDNLLLFRSIPFCELDFRKIILYMVEIRYSGSGV